MTVNASRIAHKPSVRTWTGQTLALHDKANHGSWLSIALFLNLPLFSKHAADGKRSAAAAGLLDTLSLSAGPVGNHGENKCSTADTAQEVRS